MRRPGSTAVLVAKSACLAGAIALFAPAPARAQSDPPEIVVHPDHPARQPFHKSWGVPFNDPGDGQIEVPAGKRLVLEYVSLDVSVNSDCRVGFVSLLTTAGGTVAGHHVPIATHVTFATRNVDVAGQLIRVYADPATRANVNFGVSGLNCEPIGAIGVSGYFVNVP